jgi:hypothetical protein
MNYYKTKNKTRWVSLEPLVQAALYIRLLIQLVEREIQRSLTSSMITVSEIVFKKYKKKHKEACFFEPGEFK